MKKTEISLNIGGKLSTGDVIGVAYHHSIIYGWFVDSGKNGSLKFISFNCIHATLRSYNNFLKEKDPGDWLKKRFINGITFNTLHKDFILKFNSIDNRVFKVDNPEIFFKDAINLESMYKEGKTQLNNLNFPAK